jgi:hypothetical protein
MSNNAERYLGRRIQRIQRERDLIRELDTDISELSGVRRTFSEREKPKSIEVFSAKNLLLLPEKVAEKDFFEDNRPIPCTTKAIFEFLQVRFRLNQRNEGLPSFWREFERTNSEAIQKFAIEYLKLLHKPERKKPKKGKKGK